MNTQFPVAPAKYTQLFANQLIQLLTRYFNQATSKDEQTPRVILRSPAGFNFDLTVDDSGTLVVTPTDKTRA